MKDAYPRPDLLVTPDQLAGLGDDPGVVIADCAWDGTAYGRAHIPGARLRPGHAYVKGEDAEGNPGLHLPGAERFVEMMAELGIGNDSRVVLYDDWGSLFATRLWWLLRYYGHDNASVLDGGWQGWLAAGKPVSCETAPAPSRREAFSISHKNRHTDSMVPVPAT